jgi:hypothetical protein
MKKFVFFLCMTAIMMASCTTVMAADHRVKELPEYNAAPEEVLPSKVDIKATADEVIKVLVDDKDAVIVLPDKIDITKVESLMNWWVWLTSLLSPILITIMNRFWPSSTKKELIIKSSSMGIILIWAIILIAGGGFNLTSVVFSLVMFVVQVFSYDKILQPLGVNSVKPDNYKR